MGVMLVTPLPIPNNSGSCYRVYNVNKYAKEIDAQTFLATRLVDKLYHGEVAVLLEISEGDGSCRVLTPRGIAGWCRIINLRSIDEVDK